MRLKSETRNGTLLTRLCGGNALRISVTGQAESNRQVDAQRRQRSSHAGFTLIEILVAMTIIAVGVSALVSSAAASAWRADYLREREFGRWVASNTLAELQSVPAWPANGTTNKEVEMGRFTWHVRTRTQAVADPDLRRVDIEVRLDENADNYIYTVAGFVGNPETRQGASDAAGLAQGAGAQLNQ